MHKVFVYGTLRPPLNGHAGHYWPDIAKHVVAHIPATLPNATMHNCKGAYPGALPSAHVDDVVMGDLLVTNDAGLAVMDRIEGHPSFYHREKAKIHTPEGDNEAWVYRAPVWVNRMPIIGSGDWFNR